MPEKGGDVFDDEGMLHAIKDVNLRNLGQSNLFACEDDPLSNVAHEMGHWYHAEYARQKYVDSIDTKDDLKATIKMTAEDVRHEILAMHPDFDFNKISRYAGAREEAVPDEIITESFARKMLGRDNQESRAVLEVVLGEDW